MATKSKANANDIIIPGDEAYLSFGGWAKPMANPPKMHERRRYIVDTECTDASVKSSGKGERSTRSLSILRVEEVVGVIVPAKDDDENQGELFDENTPPTPDSEIGWKTPDPNGDAGDDEESPGDDGGDGNNVVDFRPATATDSEPDPYDQDDPRNAAGEGGVAE